MTLPRTVWIWFNCLRTSIRRLRSFLDKWVWPPLVACECGTEEQTVDHAFLHFPIETLDHPEWLLNTCPSPISNVAY